MNMCLLEVVMCENAEAAISSRSEGDKKFEDWGGGTFAGGSVPHYMPWLVTIAAKKLYHRCLLSS